MENILIVSKSENNRDALARYLNKSDYINIFTAESGSSARRLLCGKDVAAVIIDAPLPDEFGIELSLHIANNYSCGCLLLVKSDKEDAAAEKTEDYGVIIVSKPINPHFFNKMLKIAMSSSRRLHCMETENKKLMVKLDEMKIIDRAKCLLIEKLKITEPQAHRHIEKQAMDLRQTKKAVAENILKTYEY